MLKILGVIAGVIVVAVLGVVAFAATRPDTFRVERSIVIAAPAEKIFPLIDNFAAWKSWSPYETKDPAMKRTYSGPAQGLGARYAWDGDPKAVGSGSMEVVESTAPSKVVLKLDFLVPFEAHNTGLFTLEPAAGGATKVTWAMEGRQPLMGKVMCLFFDMDKMVGGDFAAGLAKLKAAVEG